MSIIFNADEVFEMAEQIERDGGAFYRKSAENAQGSVRELLLEIADQEDEHLATFQKMRKELAKSEKEPTAFDPYGEAALYLQAMVDGKVFDSRQSPAGRLRGDEGLVEIARIAIGLEKDSIIFYLGLKESVPDRMGAEKITSIIQEEMKHIGWLSGKLGE